MTRFDVVSAAKSIIRGWSLLLFCMPALAGWAQPPLSVAANADDASARKQVWVDRLLEQIDQLSDESDRQLVVEQLAAAGQIQRAKTLARQKLPESKRPLAIVFIAAAQSNQGDVAGALQTLDGLPKECPIRDRGRGLVAIRQAQRGNVAEAQRVIAGITEQHSLDWVRETIAEAQASAGDRKSAAATADLIRNEDTQRLVRTTIAVMERQEFFSPASIPSPFLASQVGGLSLFSGHSSWKTQAFSTLAAAYRKDEKAVVSGAERTLAQLKALPKGLERATGFAILAVAFSEAGKPAQARNASDEALKAMPGDLLGVSNFFGTPILIYALIQQGYYEHIEKIIQAAEQNQDGLGTLYASGYVQAIGAALAAKREDQRLDKVYLKLRKPINRAHLALGGLCELFLSAEACPP